MTPKNLGELLQISAKKFPLRYAVSFGSKKIAYRELNELTNRIAAGLRNLGIRKNDKIAVFLDNCPDFILAYFSILKAGAVAVPINYMFKIEEAKFILQDSEAACLVTSRPYINMAEELLLRVDGLKHIITTAKAKKEIPDLNTLKKESPEIKNLPSVDPSDPAVILYTSGTTGHPKGAILSHYNLISNALDCAGAIKANHKDSLICVLPLFHSFAATVCMNMPLSVGAKIVLMKSVKPFKRVIRAIRRNRVSVFVGIPSMYNILKDIKLPGILHTPLIKLFNPVKVCISGAAALPVETFTAFEKRLRVPLLEGYGLTEASPVASLNPLNGIRKAGSIGLALSKNIELKIVDEHDKPVDPEQVGELLIKGPNVMPGYYKKPEASNEVLKDGWLYTGDMAKFDRDGYIYIVGRKKEMVNVRGLNVYPR